MGIRYSLIFGFALVTAFSAAAPARDFEMGGDSGFPYSIMTPERGSVPPRHSKALTKKRYVTAPHPRTLTKTYPHANLSVVICRAGLLGFGATDPVAADRAHPAGGRRPADIAGIAAGTRPVRRPGCGKSRP